MCSQTEQSKAREPRDNKRSTSPSIDFNQSAAKNVAVTDCDVTVGPIPFIQGWPRG